LGVTAAIEWLAESFEKKYKIGIKADSKADFTSIPVDLQVLIYKSVRELLVNVVKHSGASKASIASKTLKDSVEITVRDNGTGFDKKILDSVIDDCKGFGLFSISERLRYFSGSMIVDSEPGKGASITLRIPNIAR
jgi:signal transduction histidine kinase